MKDAIMFLGQCAVWIALFACLTMCTMQQNQINHAEEMAKIAAGKR